MELIKITEKDGKKLVGSKDLYQNLGLASQHYAKWYDKNLISNNFAIENEDYTELPLSGRSREFAITLDFAKKIAMMTRTKEGETVRDYFIECENISLKVLKPSYQIENTIERANAWILEETIRLNQQKTIEEQAPKVNAFSKVIDNSATFTVDSLSDAVDIGRNKLFEILRSWNWVSKKCLTGTSSTRFCEENRYGKTLFETIEYKGKEINKKKFVLTRRGFEKAIEKLNN